MSTQKKLRVGLFLGSIIGLTLVPQIGFAGERLEEFTLNPMFVTATRYEERQIDIPASTEVFTKEKIELMGAENAMEVIQNIPGFTLTASPTGNTYIGFRGIAKDNVAVLVNGIPLNQEGNYDLESIAAAGIERIEVVKGGASILYGSNASAGVINIITKKNAKNKIIIGAGDKGKRKMATNLQLGKLALSYDHTQSQDRGPIYKGSSKGQAYYYEGDKLDRDSLNLNYNPSEHWNFQYMYSHKVSDCTQYNEAAGTVMSSFHSTIDYNLGQVNYLNKDLRVSLYGKNRDWKFNTTTHQKGYNYGLDVQNKWQLKNTKLTGGVAFEKEFAENYIPNGNSWLDNSRNNGAVFFMTETPVSENTTLFLGAREAFVSKSGNEFCPQLQVLHKLNADENIYLNVNKSLRVPTLAEQYGFSATQEMNPDLKPEYGWTYEFGWKKQIKEQAALKFTLYHMELQDRIYSTKLANGHSKYFNANKYENTGLELGWEENLSDKFNYGVACSYGNPKQQLSNSDGWSRVDYKVGLNANIGYTLDNTSAALYANYVFNRVDDTRPMFNLNMNIRHKLSKDDTLVLKINNLLGRADLKPSSNSLVEERNWLLSYERSF